MGEDLGSGSCGGHSGMGHSTGQVFLLEPGWWTQDGKGDTQNSEKFKLGLVQRWERWQMVHGSNP